jgi:transcriptional regulator with XRE-family HTH domain
MEKPRSPRSSSEYPERHYLSAEAAAGLRHARQRTGLSLRGAAEKAGISFGYLCQLEHGQRCPSLSVAYDLVSAFRIDAAVAGRLFAEAQRDKGRDCVWPREGRPE